MKETRGAATVELALLSGINEWSVDQVSELFRKCKLIGAADAIAENQIDGKTLCELSDADLYSAVDDGGLGLKPLQLKRIRAELGQSSSSAGTVVLERASAKRAATPTDRQMTLKTLKRRRIRTPYTVRRCMCQFDFPLAGARARGC